MGFYSKSTKLAVRILTYLVSEGADRNRTGRDIARATQVPEPSAAKILQALAKRGILESRKGPGGGFRLASAPSKVSLAHIVAAVEGDDYMVECIGGLKRCIGHPRCPLHDKWAGVKDRMSEFLQTTSLEDMLHASHQIADFVNVRGSFL
ncbi:MAG: Rrf2 family transcriptional regulator [Nitrospinota bacterium]